MRMGESKSRDREMGRLRKDEERSRAKKGGRERELFANKHQRDSMSIVLY